VATAAGVPSRFATITKRSVSETHPLDIRHDVVSRHDELSGIAPQPLILDEGDRHDAVTILLSALTDHADVLTGRRLLVGILDLLVDLPGGRLVLRDPFLAIAHATILFLARDAAVG
jgi:hypothetical protein